MCSTSWIKQLNSLNTKCTIIKPQVDINKRIPTNNNNSVNVNSSTLVNPISGTLLYINRQIDNLKWYIATILFNQIFVLYKFDTCMCRKDTILFIDTVLTEVASQFTRSRDCKRNERSHWPQTWHRENILVFASINKLPLHCACNTKVIESNI